RGNVVEVVRGLVVVVFPGGDERSGVGGHGSGDEGGEVAAAVVEIRRRGGALKKAQEKDKIGTKPDKNRKRGKAGKSLKQLQ
nr:hypothetical protein [Tanacetum cinerariifolium]